MDDRLLRGGPLVRSVWDTGLGLTWASDSRRPTQFTLTGSGGGTRTGSRDWQGSAGLTLKPLSALSIQLTPSFYLLTRDAQYVDTYADPDATATYGARYLTAHLNNLTTTLEARVEWTFSTRVSLQSYARASRVSGEYRRLSFLQRPRTRDFGEVVSAPGADGLLTVSAPGSLTTHTLPNPDFLFSSLQANAVFRYEYLPGSTLFVVWQRDGGLLRGSTPRNTVMVKLTYWFNA